MSRCLAGARPLARGLRQPQRLCAPRCLSSGGGSSLSSSSSLSSGGGLSSSGSSLSSSGSLDSTPSSSSSTLESSSTPDSSSSGADGPRRRARRPYEGPPSLADLDPDTVLPPFEASLMRAGRMPVGSRRRRAAMRVAGAVPFERLPYQAFQEALAVLAADREEKLARLRAELARIARLEQRRPEEVRGGRQARDDRLAAMRAEAERLKILADINDPLVKKRFEDGLGDMNKPIYRHLARKRWLAYDHKVITQRIQQFHIVPDLLPKLEPSADVQLFFRKTKVPPGQKVASIVSEAPPRLRVQLFDKGERLFTVVVVDADVPVVEVDGFAKRCHFLAANVPLSPTDGSLPLSRIRADDQLAVPWLPPFSQKGAPYHRLAVFLLEQGAGARADVARMRELYAARDGFSVKSLRDRFAGLGLRPVGFTLFRAEWDADTDGVMARHGIAGADVEFRRVPVRSLKPPVKARGWEAKRQGPKFRHLWKYTRRIKGLSSARGWVKRR